MERQSVSQPITVTRRLTAPSFRSMPDPNKPKTIYCRRGQLIKWTGWTDEEIAFYIERDLLHPRDTPGRRRLYYVRQVQELIDSGK